MFEREMPGSKYYGFPIMQRGLANARWPFGQISFTKTPCSACICKVFQNQFNISEGEKLFWNAVAAGNSCKDCDVRDLKELTFKVNLDFSYCAVLKEN